MIPVSEKCKIGHIERSIDFMRKAKFVKGIALALCMVSLTGCGAVNSQNENTKNSSDSENNPVAEPGKQTEKETRQETESQYKETEQSFNMDTLLEQAVLQGSVAEFSDGVIKVVPQEEKDEGQTLMQAAFGEEGSLEQTTVRYDENCEFQIVEVDGTTGAAQMTPCDASEVKKQTDVAVFGEKQDSGEILAGKIFIMRYFNASGVGGE